MKHLTFNAETAATLAKVTAGFTDSEIIWSITFIITNGS